MILDHTIRPDRDMESHDRKDRSDRGAGSHDRTSGSDPGSGQIVESDSRSGNWIGSRIGSDRGTDSRSGDRIAASADRDQ